jgi:hypothetical protein
MFSSSVRGPGMEPFMLHGRHKDGPMHRVEKPRGITRDYISGIRLRPLAIGIRTYATVPVLKGPVGQDTEGKRFY